MGKEMQKQNTLCSSAYCSFTESFNQLTTEHTAAAHSPVMDQVTMTNVRMEEGKKGTQVGVKCCSKMLR